MSTPQNSSSAAQVTASISGKDLQKVFNRPKEQKPERDFKWLINAVEDAKDHYALAEALTLIDENREELYDSVISNSGLNAWFNAYLCSEDFVSLSPERRKKTLRTFSNVNMLLTSIQYHYEQNNMI